jgi:methyl coenzyme M reductase gamma subunit
MKKEEFETEFDKARKTDDIVFIRLDNEAMFIADYFCYYRNKKVLLSHDGVDIGSVSLDHIVEIY